METGDQNMTSEVGLSQAEVPRAVMQRGWAGISWGCLKEMLINMTGRKTHGFLWFLKVPRGGRYRVLSLCWTLKSFPSVNYEE